LAAVRELFGHPDGLTALYPKMSSAGHDSTQIAAPQRAANQASESHTSRSSRFKNRAVLRGNRKVLFALFLLSFIACSYFIIVAAVGLGDHQHGGEQSPDHHAVPSSSTAS